MPRLDSASLGATRARHGWTILAALAVALVLFQVPVGAAAAQREPGSAERGARLFSGQMRFAAGGPPCAACHAVAGLPFPGGGVMGPELTDAYQKYGPEALGTMLATLFFPTMNPIFAGRLLTAAEQADLEAFLAAAGTSPAPAVTGRLLLGGLLLLAAAVALMAWVGRAQLSGVRAALVADARRARGGRP